MYRIILFVTQCRSCVAEISTKLKLRLNMTEFKTPLKTKILYINDIITIPPSPFLARLGHGAGVSVMELVRSPRAVKIRSPAANRELSERVEYNTLFDRTKNESDLLRRMSHPNIVGFRAFSRGRVLYSGIEACDLSLGDMIEKRIEHDGATAKPFMPKQILKVASDIASALDYLHTKMQILHGDMKSYNIIVNGDFVICKLCDFGVSLPLDENGLFHKTKAGKSYVGTDPWRAPEVIHGGKISCKTDIWSLGLTLWEMMALVTPHNLMYDDDDSTDDSVEDFDYPLEKIGDYFKHIYGTRPSIPWNISENLYSHPLELFYSCTETISGRRPTAQHLCIAAQDMLDECEKTARYIDGRVFFTFRLS